MSFKSDVSVIKPCGKKITNVIFIRGFSVMFKKKSPYLDGFKSTDSYLRSGLLGTLTTYMVLVLS